MAPGSGRPLRAAGVSRSLVAEHLDGGLAPVYGVLTQFEQGGLLVRRHFEAGRAVFELNEGPHHDHLVCLACGRVEEYVDPEVEQRQKAIALERGFELQDHALAMYGVCPKPNSSPRDGG